MTRKQDTGQQALLALVTAFIVVLAAHPGLFRGTDGPWVSFTGPEAGLFFMFRDEPLGKKGLPHAQTGAFRAQIVAFNQSSVRPCFQTAPARLFRAVPGIGESLTSAIIEFRNEAGRVSSADALLRVPGIGAKRVEAISRAFQFGPCEGPPDPMTIDL